MDENSQQPEGIAHCLEFVRGWGEGGQKSVDEDPEQLARIAHFIEGVLHGRDPVLAGHQGRSRRESLALGRAIGCSVAELGSLSVGAHLHDIGKMSISDRVLNKPFALNHEELALVRQHSRLGEKLLEPLDLDPEILDIVAYHHENYDGSGYPEGLKGESIPLLARIVRIVDSFDALTSDRPYHRGIDRGKALEVLRLDVRFYDPTLLDAFCANVS